jgi:hypothetical protein
VKLVFFTLNFFIPFRIYFKLPHHNNMTRFFPTNILKIERGWNVCNTYLSWEKLDLLIICCTCINIISLLGRETNALLWYIQTLNSKDLSSVMSFIH